MITMLYVVTALFKDTGIAYIEATSQAQAEEKARGLDGGAFEVGDSYTDGTMEILNVEEEVTRDK